VFTGIGVIVSDDQLKPAFQRDRYWYDMAIILVAVCFSPMTDFNSSLYYAEAEDCNAFTSEINGVTDFCFEGSNYGPNPVFVSGCGNVFQCGTNTLSASNGASSGTATTAPCLHTDANLKNNAVRFEVCVPEDFEPGTTTYLTNSHGVQLQQILDIGACVDSCFDTSLSLDDSLFQQLLLNQLYLTIYDEANLPIYSTNINMQNPGAEPCNIDSCPCNFPETCSQNPFQFWCSALKIPSTPEVLVDTGNTQVCLGPGATITYCGGGSPTDLYDCPSNFTSTIE